MRLTTKGRYAVTAMLDLALNQAQAPIALADISERQSISQSYLEQLFAKLRKRSLVVSLRGPGGGYRLGKSVKDITISDIIAAVDETVDATSCKGEGNCQDGAVCLTHQLWSELNEKIQEFLSNISLEELISRKDIQLIATQQRLRTTPAELITSQ
ncbi:MAG: Fe-S cluster assembly transcriptional regulator IscR [Cellvibrionales bacterium]|nr:Fe-S cluster assembly transcriptional regulator IscR [Cellvibrionales bacterium]